jgi:NAD(P)-dependent dehydrogenase (short-subunit alcohol dehydrogenase family)
VSRLKQRVALITGAGQGIGRAIALKLAMEGADVMIVDVNSDTAAAVVRETESLGVASAWVTVDVSRATDRTRGVAATIERFDHIDILVNAAGIVSLNSPLDISEEEWDRIQAINVKGTYFMCQAVLRHMLVRRSGCIVNLSSTSAKAGVIADIHYNVSKAAVLVLTRNLAMAYGKYGIRVNSICPGSTDTAMFRKICQEAAGVLGIDPSEYLASRMSAISLGRLGTPSDVANLAAFLCSDEASYITGQAINVDGGAVFH